ncbi:MAG: hypothetical protein ACR2OZ_15190 [Verrucomicrobiales bacterium]
MKTLSLPILSCFLIFSVAEAQIVPPPGSGPLPPPPAGLTAWWTFDELQSDVCFDYADDFAADLSWDGARSSGIVHRDLAGRNILLAATGDLDGDGTDEFLRCSRQGWDGTIKGNPFTVGFWMAADRTQTLAPPASIVDARVITEIGPAILVRGFAIRFSGPQIGAVFGRGTLGPNVNIARALPPALSGQLTHIACVCPAPSTGGALPHLR